MKIYLGAKSFPVRYSYHSIAKMFEFYVSGLAKLTGGTGGLREGI